MALFSILDTLNKGTSNKNTTTNKTTTSNKTTSTSNKTTSSSNKKTSSSTSTGAGRYTSNNPYASQTSTLVNNSKPSTTTTTKPASTTTTTTKPTTTTSNKTNSTSSSSNKTSTSSSTSTGAGRYYSNNPYSSQTSAVVNSSKPSTSTTTKPATETVPLITTPTTNKTTTPTYGPVSTTPTTNYIPGTNLAVNNSTKVPTTNEIVSGIISGNLVANNTPDYSSGLLSKDPVGTTASNILSSGSVVNQQPVQQNTKPVATTTTPTTTKPTSTPVTTPTTTTKPTTTTNKTPSEVVYEETMNAPTNYAGTSGTVTNEKDEWLDAINQLHETKKQQAIAAIQNAMDNAIAGYEASIDGLPQQYDPLRSQSEYERYKSQKALEEQLANSGNTYSGMGRQDTLNLQNSYSNQLNSLNMAEQNEKEELQRLIEQTRRDGEFNKANASYDFDIAAYQAALDKQSEDRQYEWQKYLQDYQEKQDALDREFQTTKYLNSLKNNYTTGTSGSGTSSNTSYQLSGNSANQMANYNTKTAVNEAVNNLQMNGVNDSNAEYAEEVIKAYYIKNGKYPTTNNVDKFIEEYNKLTALGKKFTEDDIANYAARMNFTPYETILAYTIYGGN